MHISLSSVLIHSVVSVEHRPPNIHISRRDDQLSAAGWWSAELSASPAWWPWGSYSCSRQVSALPRKVSLRRTWEGGVWTEGMGQRHQYLSPSSPTHAARRKQTQGPSRIEGHLSCSIQACGSSSGQAVARALWPDTGSFEKVL